MKIETTKDRSVYVKPELEVVDIEIEGAILEDSSTEDEDSEEFEIDPNAKGPWGF